MTVQLPPVDPEPPPPVLIDEVPPNIAEGLLAKAAKAKEKK